MGTDDGQLNLVGHDADEVAAFLQAANSRIDALRTEIAEARAQMTARAAEDEAAGEVRSEVASTWTAAHRESARIRADADAEAASILARASEAANGIRAHPVVPKVGPVSTDNAVGS